MGGVPVALLGTGDASCRAGLDRRANEADVGTGLSRCDARGRLADVRAVETDPNHADQLLQVVLAQAGVRAGGAARTTVETLLGTPNKRPAVVAGRKWVQRNDVAKGHQPQRGGRTRNPRHRRVQRDRRRSQGEPTRSANSITPGLPSGCSPRTSKAPRTRSGRRRCSSRSSG